MPNAYSDPDLSYRASLAVSQPLIAPQQPQEQEPEFDPLAAFDASAKWADEERAAGRLPEPTGVMPVFEEPKQQAPATPAPERGWLGDLGAAGVRGLYTVPEQMAKAYEGVGRAAKDFAGVDLPGTQGAGEIAESIGKARDEAFPVSQAARDSSVRGAITQGAESATTSLTPALAGAAIGSAFGPVGTVAGGLIGLFSNVPTFSAAQYRDTMKDAEAKGIDPEKAKWTALVNAASEGGTELLSDVIAAATGGGSKVLTAVGKDALKAGISPLLKQGWKPMLANMGKVFGAEASTELLNSGIQAEANKAAGIDDKGFWGAVAENAGPVGVASLIFSTIGGGMTVAGRRRIENALTNPEVHPAEREAAINAVTGQLASVDPVAAKVWDESARTAVAENKAIPLGEDLNRKTEEAYANKPTLPNDTMGPDTPLGVYPENTLPGKPIGNVGPDIATPQELPPVETIKETLATAGLADKPEWQQAIATFDALTGNQTAVERAMPGAQAAKPREVIPEVKPSGDGGDDSYAGAPAQAALAPAMERAYYDPAQVDARYQRGIQDAAAQAEAERAAQAEPFPQTIPGLEPFVAAPTPEQQPSTPKVLSRQEQAQVNTLTKRIGNLTKLLAVEKNPAARARTEETRAGYEVELRNLTGETAPVLTPEEQARAEELRRPPAALPPGQGFDLVGAPQDVTQAEAASMEPDVIAAQQPGEPLPTAKELADLDAGRNLSEAQLVRQYQEQRQRSAQDEYGTKGLSSLWDFLRGRVDAKSISDTFGSSVLESLRGKAPRDLFRSREKGGMAWDKLEQEAKSQGLLGQDADLLDTLISNVTNKEQAQRDRVNGVNGVWQREEIPAGSNMPAPEETGMVPLNSDGTVRDGAGPMYRKEDKVSDDDISTAGAKNDEIETARRMWAEMGTDSPYFKKWSEDAPVVGLNESHGFKTNQKVVVKALHGSSVSGFVESSDIKSFDKSKAGDKFGSPSEGAFFFSNLPGVADDYANYGKGGTPADQGAVYPVYLSFKNPLVVDGKWFERLGMTDHISDEGVIASWDNYHGLIRERAKRSGHDGVIMLDGPERMYVAFSSQQIKSSIGNRGTFDQNNADIRYRQNQPNAQGLASPDVKTALVSTPYAGVEVLDSPADLADAGLLDELRRTGNLGSKGAYDPRTGKAYVFAGNHADVADAIQTARDELFHRGTFRWAEQQAQANPKAGPAFKQLNGFMAQVRYARRDDINTWLDENGYGELKNTNYGAAEWLTHEASKQAPKWHDRYVAALVEFFRKMGNALGFDFKMTEAEIRNWSRKVEAGMGEETGLRGENPAPLEQRTYQGSPTRGIERMSDEYLGTGEGGRTETNNDYSGAYGYGHYSAQNRKTAEWYRQNLSYGESALIDGERFERTNNGWVHEDSGLAMENHSAEAIALDAYQNEQGKAGLRERLNEIKEDGENFEGEAEATRQALKLYDSIEEGKPGQLYQLEVPDSDKLLDWDKPLSEQPAGVRERLVQAEPQDLVTRANGEFRNTTGQDFYNALAEELGSAKAASQYLDSIGIPGHQYLDGSSRSKGDGTHNVVTYSDKNVDITGTFYRKATPQRTPAPAFDNPETEARYREAIKGIGDQRGAVAKVKDWLGEQKAGFTRHFINMPNTPEFAEAHEALRQLEAAPTVAKEEAVRNLTKVTGNLSPGAYDLFSRKVILDDLAHEAELGHSLPFGFTPESLAKERNKINRAADNTAEVRDALVQRKAIMDDLTGRLVDAGILSADQIKNPAYFRHEVLEYAREWQQSQGSGGTLKTPKPGYAKSREGSEKDISANYLEVEYAFMQRAMVDLKTVETLNKIKSRYDIMPQVKASAQEANAKALAAMGMDAAGMTEGQKREALGTRYKDWSDMVPEGYGRFQADKGLIYHSGNAITDKAMLSLMDTLQMDDKAFQARAPEVVLDLLNGVRQQLMVGGKKPEMVLPQGMVDTLNNLRPKREKSFFDQALSKPLGLWKQWTLINPRRVLKYNLNNLSGDLDAVIAGNPQSLKKLPEAIRELRAVMKGGDPSQDYLDAVERGVFDSGLSVQEIPDVAKLDAFQNLMANTQGQNNPLTWVRKGWRALQDYTQFRENWMRLAAYKDYLRRIEAGEDMKSIGYGAADPRIVDALSDPKDRAALLARSLVGDYGAVSHYGQGLRNKVIPFYSWMEVNAKRYGQLIQNAFGQGIGQGLKTGGLTATMLGARASVYLGVRMAAMYALIGAYNHLFHGDDEEKLSDLDRQQLHVILGHDKDGNIHTLKLQGALSDFLSWFGYEDAVKAFKDIQSGRGSYSDVLKAMGKAPFNKVMGGLTPLLKTPLEFAMGQSTYPDVFNPRPMQDKGREAARLFSAENEYDALANNPTRGYWKSWLQAVDYSRNVGEISYNNTMDLVRKFKESKGVEEAGYSSTPKSRLIREYKLAMRYGDDAAAKAAMEKMQAEGVTRDDVEKSLLRSTPLSGLAQKERKEFMASLSPREQDQVQAAEDWYKDTYLDSDMLKSKYEYGKLAADYRLLHTQEKELSKAGNYSEAHKLKMENDLYRKGNLVSMVEKVKRQRKQVAESNLPDDEKARRLANFDQRLKEAMDRAVQAAGTR